MLRNARSVAYKWIGEIVSKLDEIEDETSHAKLRRRLCTLAATCFSTYDVCLEHVPWTLSSDNDIAIAVHCAILVYDNTPSNLRGDDSRHLSRLLNQHRRLLHFLEPFLCGCVQSNQLGFDHGLAMIWPEFHRQTSSNWHVLPTPNSRWISCFVEDGRGVHYNLLSGKSLIGGKPLARLPQDIIQHSTYANILGTVSVIIILIYAYLRVFIYSMQRMLDVVPSENPKMEYMTRSNVSGYQVNYRFYWSVL